MSETVLVVGSSGNIGISAIKAALTSGRKVLAVVRSKASADKVVANIGAPASEGITFAYVDDLTSDDALQGVVDRVRAGELPAFQHVYSTVGGEYDTSTLLEIEPSRLRKAFSINFMSNFLVYRATIPYLQTEQKSVPTTWTICTGASGELPLIPLGGMTQGALFTLCVNAASELKDTNVRFNEVYLSFKVEVDADAAEHGVVSASDFARVYEEILARPEIVGSRVRVEKEADIANIRYESKI